MQNAPLTRTTALPKNRRFLRNHIDQPAVVIGLAGGYEIRRRGALLADQAGEIRDRLATIEIGQLFLIFGHSTYRDLAQSLFPRSCFRRLAGIGLDLDAGNIYWTDSRTSKVQRANLDGTNVEDLITTRFDQPVGIAVDSVGQQLFVMNDLGDGIRRASLDGTNVEIIGPDPGPFVLDVDIDLSVNTLYWTVFSNPGSINKIQRANFVRVGISHRSNCSGLQVQGFDEGSCQMPPPSLTRHYQAIS